MAAPLSSASAPFSQVVKSKIEAYLKDADLADDTLLDYVMVLLSNRKVRKPLSIPVPCAAAAEPDFASSSRTT